MCESNRVSLSTAKAGRESTRGSGWISSAAPMFELPLGWIDKGVSQMKYLLLWGLGVPIPVLIIGYLIFH
jgi:hypothetical protein